MVLSYTLLATIKSGLIFSLLFFMSYSFQCKSKTTINLNIEKRGPQPRYLANLLAPTWALYSILNPSEAECTGRGRNFVQKIIVGLKLNDPKTLADNHVHGGVINCQGKEGTPPQPQKIGKTTLFGDGFVLKRDPISKTGCGTLNCPHNCPVILFFNTTTYDSTKGTEADARAQFENIGHFGVFNKLEGTYSNPGENPDPNNTKSQAIIFHEQDRDITAIKKDYHQCQNATEFLRAHKMRIQHVADAAEMQRVHKTEVEKKLKRWKQITKKPEETVKDLVSKEEPILLITDGKDEPDND